MRDVPVALQLYSVRDALATDPRGTIRRVAQMGYRGVEPFGLTPAGAALQRALFDEFGLLVPSVHAPLHEPDKARDVLAVAAALGCERVVSGYGPDDFETLADVERCCRGFEAARAMARDSGLRYGIHNHWWEFEPLGGTYPYRVLLERLDPDIFFEVDVYWVQAAGLDPASVLQELGPRAELLHMKDGSTSKDDAMTALGTGAVDIAGLAAATRASAHWWIVELDRCDTDMFAAVDASLRYLEGLER